MINELIEKLKFKRETIDFESDMIDYENRYYSPIGFSRSFYNKITQINSEKTIAFIDGGNAEIIKKANLSVQLVRIYYCIYKNNKRIETCKYEYFIISRIKNSCFSAEMFGDKEIMPEQKDLELSSNDETIKEGLARANVSRIGSIARSFSECIVAKQLQNEVGYVLIDGTLQAQVTNHKKYIDQLNKKVYALSKSSELVTKNGYSLNSMIYGNTDNEIWYYYPILKKKETNIDIYFIKLNKKSKKCFRFETKEEEISKINEMLNIMIKNSTDPIFFGYPYGLIEADKFARISNEEKEYYKTIISTKSQVTDEESSHSILDRISY